MTVIETPSPRAEWYVESVRQALADLPDDERDELLNDVESHVAEVSSEAGDELVARLGPPDAFAAELRAAAGLPAFEPGSLSSRDRLGTVVESIRELLRPLAPVVELVPAWWVLRGYVAAVVLSVWIGNGWPSGWLPELGPTLVSLVMLGAFVAGSSWLGLRVRNRELRRPARLALAATNLVAVIAIIPVASAIGSGGYYYTGVSSEPPPLPGLSVDGTPLANVYAVDRDGNPLLDVRLYDESGQPLNINPGDQDTARRIVTDNRGTQMFNAFPIRYREPGGTVLEPYAGFPVGVPAVATDDLTPTSGTTRPVP